MSDLNYGYGSRRTAQNNDVHKTALKKKNNNNLRLCYPNFFEIDFKRNKSFAGKKNDYYFQ